MRGSTRIARSAAIAAFALGGIAGQAVSAERPLDAAKSELTFSVKEMGVAVSGRFKRFTAKIDLDPARLETASAQIKVDVDSLDTGSDEGDETARDPAWLDVVHFPQATFASSAVRAIGNERYEAKGMLSIRGQPREITVPFTLKSQPGGGAIVDGDLKIRRTDFGIGGGQWNQSDLVADEVPIHFHLVLGAAQGRASAASAGSAGAAAAQGRASAERPPRLAEPATSKNRS